MKHHQSQVTTLPNGNVRSALTGLVYNYERNEWHGYNAMPERLAKGNEDDR